MSNVNQSIVEFANSLTNDYSLVTVSCGMGKGNRYFIKFSNDGKTIKQFDSLSRNEMYYTLAELRNNKILHIVNLTDFFSK